MIGGKPVLIDNIGTLVTNDPELGTIARRRAGLRRRPRRLGGTARATPEGAGGERFDAQGRAVIPGFVDSHGHLVFAGERAEEFAARMAGKAVHRRGDQDHGRRPPARPSDEQLGANVDRLMREGAALRARRRWRRSPATG